MRILASIFIIEPLRVKAKTEPIPRSRAWRLASLRLTNCLKSNVTKSTFPKIQYQTCRWTETFQCKTGREDSAPGPERARRGGWRWRGGWSCWMVQRDNTESWLLISERNLPARPWWPGWVAGLGPARRGPWRLQKFGGGGDGSGGGRNHQHHHIYLKFKECRGYNNDW